MFAQLGNASLAARMRTDRGVIFAALVRDFDGVRA
jgi:hypothetical protein